MCRLFIVLSIFMHFRDCVQSERSQQLKIGNEPKKLKKKRKNIKIHGFTIIYQGVYLMLVKI